MKLRALAVPAVLLSFCLAAHADKITFAGLQGKNGDTFTTYTDGTFTVSQGRGQFFVAKSFGDPIPDIFGGYLGGPSTSSVVITENDGGNFNFGSVDLAADIDFSTFLFTGKLDGKTVFSQSGLVFGDFSKFLSQSSSSIDSLTIQLSGADYNVDNIVVSPASTSPVPEPSTFALLGTGLVGAAGAMRRKLRRS